MYGKQRFLLAVIIALVVAALVVVSQLPARLGLDLRGGAQLTLAVQTTEAVPEITPRVLEAVQSVVEGRINGLGVSEAVVQTSGNDQLLVQLPGVSDPEQAERVLGGTAQLEFLAQRPGTEVQLPIEQRLLAELLLERSQLETAEPVNAQELAEIREKVQRQEAEIAKLYESTELTGDRLRDAFAQAPAGATGSWRVVVQFDTRGGDLFAQLTRNIAGTGRTLGIFLDERLISAPTVQAQYAETGIVGGTAEISGNFDAQSANDLAIQLRGGALPVPVEIVENRTVGATLGRDSIRRSIYAGLGGLVLVLAFMVFYYRLPGLIADIALCIYALLTYAAFVLVGVTLTLPGIAGFILSIGMAVDANVLIFERTREELQAGKTLYRSIESGFYRAFSSILDSAITTLIACGALIWLGSGLVRGFAITLAIGVCVSIFTAVTCSRTLLFLSISIPSLRKPVLFAPRKVEAIQ
ncbi:protein translocase subunit SecD [Synechococcales cyanobacterium C]|uniref:Protein translocase subunit SecD n=1 Tax=Petrachloros mirabilis ULC683 TaxID=2781853 RepID=A0A8K2A027_9CYAN|nr:protein translocase subunit SecD [Petrachloros mirabilis ULC683]